MKLFPSKSKRCDGCNNKIKSTDHSHELRLETIDGVVTMEICESCANFLDLSTDVLQSRKHHNDITV